MNIKNRAELVKAMKLIATSINDEDIIDSWLMFGVADGDTDYESYVEDETFVSVIDCFMRCMVGAAESGGIYCDTLCGGEVGIPKSELTVGDAIGKIADTTTVEVHSDNDVTAVYNGKDSIPNKLNDRTVVRMYAQDDKIIIKI
jgi:hypothetical protein